MNKEMKHLLRGFFLSCTIISCSLLLFCGSVTAAQRTAYNTYLKEYAVLSMVSQGETVKMKGFNEDVVFDFPSKNEWEKAKRYLRLTPFACAVFFYESAVNLVQEIAENVLT